MYKHAMTAVATAATSVLLVASPAAADDARSCVPAVVPQSAAEGVKAFRMEIQRFVEKLVQVLKEAPAAPGSRPATPTLDQAGAQALLAEVDCQSADDDVPPVADDLVPPVDGAAAPPGEENCRTYQLGPGWAPSWPMLELLGVRELIEQSSGVATVCVFPSLTPPDQTPSTTAVEPQPQDQPQPQLQEPIQSQLQNQPLPQSQLKEPTQPRSQVIPAERPAQAAPRVRLESQVNRMQSQVSNVESHVNRVESHVNTSAPRNPYTWIRLQPGRGSLLDGVGITAQLRVVAGD